MPQLLRHHHPRLLPFVRASLVNLYILCRFQIIVYKLAFLHLPNKWSLIFIHHPQLDRHLFDDSVSGLLIWKYLPKINAPSVRNLSRRPLEESPISDFFIKIIAVKITFSLPMHPAVGISFSVPAVCGLLTLCTAGEGRPDWHGSPG